MTNYKKARVKLSNSQFKKLEAAEKNEIGAALTVTRKKFQYGELPHEL